MICNKILGIVTKFGEKRTKTLGVANSFMVGGHNVPPSPLGLYRVNNLAWLVTRVWSVCHGRTFFYNMEVQWRIVKNEIVRCDGLLDELLLLRVSLCTESRTKYKVGCHGYLSMRIHEMFNVNSQLGTIFRLGVLTKKKEIGSSFPIGGTCKREGGGPQIKITAFSAYFDKKCHFQVSNTVQEYLNHGTLWRTKCLWFGIVSMVINIPRMTLSSMSRTDKMLTLTYVIILTTPL